MRKIYLVLICSIILFGWQQTAMADVPYGINLLTNPNCDNNDFAGWTKTDGGSGWSANGCWRSSYQLCEMDQTVDLLIAGFSETELDAMPTLLASIGFECPWGSSRDIGRVYVYVQLLDASDNVLQTLEIKNMSYSVTSIPWDAYSKEITLSTGTRKLKYHFEGKDDISWGGQYGPAFDDLWLGLYTDPSQLPTNAVICSTVENGSFSVDKTTATEGETVTITATPATDYALKSISATKTSGNGIVVSSSNTFTMPVGFDVNVSGQFWKVKNLNVSCSTVENGTITVDKAVADAGDVVTITATPSAGYVLGSLTAKTSNNESVTVDQNETFVMPSGYDVTVSGVFAVATGIRSSETTSIQVCAEGHSIVVKNAADNQSSMVYDVAGRCVVNTFERNINMPQAGLYVVHIGGQVYKVLLK